MKLCNRPQLLKALKEDLRVKWKPWQRFASFYAMTVALLAFMFVEYFHGADLDWIVPALVLMLMGTGTLILWLGFYRAGMVIVRLPLLERLLLTLLLSVLVSLPVMLQDGLESVDDLYALSILGPVYQIVGIRELIELDSASLLFFFVVYYWRMSRYDIRSRRYYFFMAARKYLREHPQYIERHRYPDRSPASRAFWGTRMVSTDKRGHAWLPGRQPVIYQRGDGSDIYTRFGDGLFSIVGMVSGVVFLSGLIMGDYAPLKSRQPAVPEAWVRVTDSFFTADAIWDKNGAWANPQPAALVRVDDNFAPVFDLEVGATNGNYRFEFLLRNPDGIVVRRDTLNTHPNQQSWAVMNGYTLTEAEYATGTWTAILLRKGQEIARTEVILIH